MKRILLIVIPVCALLAACLPSGSPTPTATPLPYTLNSPEEIKQFLDGWEPTAQAMRYAYKITDVASEKDSNGDVTGWVIRATDPGAQYTNGMCVVPIIGLSVVIKNYVESGRASQIQNVAPATLGTGKVICYDSEGTEQQRVSTRFTDLVGLGKGEVDSNRMLMRLTLEP